MLLDMYEGISECLCRLESGALVGYLLTPDGGTWAPKGHGGFLGGRGPSWGGAGEMEPGDMVVRMLILDPFLSREKALAA